MKIISQSQVFRGIAALDKVKANYCTGDQYDDEGDDDDDDDLNDADEDDDDLNDLYIIGAVCLSVCGSQKSLCCRFPPKCL